MVGRERSVSLRALGAYFSGFILISTCLSSPPTKVFAQSGKDDAADVVPRPPTGPLDFMIERLVDATSNTWVPVGQSPQDAIENGLRFRLRAVNAPVQYQILEWSRDGSPFGWEPQVQVAWSGSATHQIRLQVWGSDWNPLPPVTKTIWVAGPMSPVATLPDIALGTTPVAAAVDGARVWTLVGGGLLGFVDLPDPNRPNAMSFVAPGESLAQANSMTLYRSGTSAYLYIANRNLGVPIFRTAQTSVQLVGRIPATVFGGDLVTTVARVGNLLFVGAEQSGQLGVFDVSNPAQPALVRMLSIPDGILTMAASDSGAFVVVQTWRNYSVGFIDASNLARPVTYHNLYAPIQLSVGASGELASAMSAAQGGSALGIQLFDVAHSGNGLTAEPAGWIGRAGVVHSVVGNRLYLVSLSPYELWKYDITDPFAPYAMERRTIGGVHFSFPLGFDPDGETGPARSVLLLGVSQFGYQILTR